MFKRVAAGPGTRVGLQANHLRIDGRELRYTPITGPEGEAIRRGTLGSVLELEEGNGPAVHISFTLGASSHADLEDFVVPDGTFFVLGSNRDRSADSRTFGVVPRERILGAVVLGGRGD